MTDTRAKLLDAAAELVQTRGYHGCSFHDLADRVSIRTASIHYHFPTKADLGQALVARYTADFMAALGEPAAGPADKRLRHYIALFREALSKGRMCLGGMIGAEVDGVPQEVGQEVRGFFDANEAWLARVYEHGGLPAKASRSRARLVLSALEGAMLISRTSQNMAAFEDVAKQVLSLGTPAE